MDEEKELPVFRIAFRAEGKMINAYFASPDTMEDAQLLGSVLRSVCDEDKSVFEAFKALMKQVMIVACTGALGAPPEGFEETPAPEHERAGRG